MAENITTFPILEPITSDANSPFSPSGAGGGGFSPNFTGDIFTSRGRFGNGTNYWDITAVSMKSANFVSGVSGCYIGYDGNVEFNEGVFRGDIAASNIDLTGGTIRYQKTSFTDSTNAGYYISADGVYFGAAGDITKFKYSITTGNMDYVGTMSNSAGVIVLDSAAQTILKDFTFGTTDYSGALKTGDITWNTSTGVVTGGTGIIVNRNGIVGALAGTAKFALLSDGTATFAGALSAATGTFAGTVSAGAIIVGTDASLIEMASQSDFPPDTNLAGYWSFDEGAGDSMADSSGAGNALTIAGTPSFVAGVSGKCLDFDGSTNYMRKAVANFRSSDSAGFISCWIKTTGTASIRIFCSSDEAATDKLMLLYVAGAADGEIRFSQNNGGTNNIVKGTTAVNDGNWHHIVVASSGTAWKIYVDGVEEDLTVSSGANNGNWFADTDGRDNIVIGALITSDGTSGYWDGEIDELRIYSVVPTAAQVYALYKQPQGGKSFNVPVGALVSGKIFSKQITLAVAGGTGDSYIAGGNNLDLANWRGGDANGGAYILGQDDSVANDPAKLFVGNYSTNNYFSYNGATDLRFVGCNIQTAADGTNRILIASTDAGYIQFMNTADKREAGISFSHQTNGGSMLLLAGNAAQTDTPGIYLDYMGSASWADFYPTTSVVTLGYTTKFASVGMNAINLPDAVEAGAPTADCKVKIKVNGAYYYLAAEEI